MQESIEATLARHDEAIKRHDDWNKAQNGTLQHFERKFDDFANRVDQRFEDMHKASRANLWAVVLLLATVTLNLILEFARG